MPLIFIFTVAAANYALDWYIPNCADHFLTAAVTVLFFMNLLASILNPVFGIAFAVPMADVYADTLAHCVFGV